MMRAWNLTLLLFSACCFVDLVMSQCALTSVTSRRTYRYFRLEIDGLRCLNPEAIEGLKECRGNCTSRGRYTSGNSTILRDCWCCTPVGTPEQIEVTFECQGGHRVKRKMLMPTECECRSCEIRDNINPEVPIPT